MPTEEIITLSEEVRARLDHGGLAVLGPVEIGPRETLPNAELAARIVLADVDHWSEREAAGDKSHTHWQDLADQLRTVLRQVHHLLATHAQRLDALTGQMPGILWSTDDQLRVTSVAGAEAAELGHRLDQRVSLPLSKFLGFTNLESLTLAAHRRAREGKVGVCDVMWRGRPHRIRVAPFFGPNGEVVGTVGTAIRVHEGSLTETSPVSTAQRFERALRGTPVMVYSQDRELRHTWVYNARPGFSPEMVIGKTDADFVTPEEAATQAAIKQRVLATGVGERHEVRVTIGGEVAYYDLTVEPLRDLTGQTVGITGAATDITALKQAQEALAQREAQLAEAQHLAQVGSWEWDLTTRQLHWSDEHYRIFGFDPVDGIPSIEAAQGRIHPEDQAGTMAIWENSLGTGEPYASDFRIVHPDGAVRVVHSRGAMMLDASGRPERMIGTAQDITERVQAEAERATDRERQARLDGMLYAARELTANMSSKLELSRDVMGQLPDGSLLSAEVREAINAITSGVSGVMQDVVALQRLIGESQWTHSSSPGALDA